MSKFNEARTCSHRATSAPLVAPFERLGVATLKVPWRPGARDNRQPREAAMEVLR